MTVFQANLINVCKIVFLFFLFVSKNRHWLTDKQGEAMIEYIDKIK